MQRSNLMVSVGWAAAATSPTLAIALVSSVLLLDTVSAWLVGTFTIGIVVLGAYGLLLALSPLIAGRFGTTTQSSDVVVPSVRPSGLAAITGGILFVAQGIMLMRWNVNLDVLPLALLLFAVGSVGLRLRLHRHRGIAGLIGGILASFAFVAALAEAFALLLMRWDEARFWPIHVAGIQLGLLALILALVFLGLAAFRRPVLPSRWRAAPLAIGVLWIALFALGEWVGDVLSPYREINLGFVPAGLAWIVLGYIIGFVGHKEQTAQSPTGPPIAPQSSETHPQRGT